MSAWFKDHIFTATIIASVLIFAFSTFATKELVENEFNDITERLSSIQKSVDNIESKVWELTRK